MKISVVIYSELIKHPEFRLDAECYTPYHLKIEKYLYKKGFSLIENYSISVINFGAYSLCNHINFLEYGKPFLVTEDINNNVIDTEKLHYISDEIHTLLHKSHCKKDQVLLTMAGAYLGQAAVFNADFECSSNQAIAKITLKPNSINPYYLSTYLNCKHGQSQIERFKTGTGQPNLNLGLIKLIKVPYAAIEFQEKIDYIINTALSFRKNSAVIYNSAQEILLAELGLTDWQPKHQLTFIKNYSDTKDAERMDAEYFQPKYDEIVDAIKKYRGGYTLVRKEFSQDKSILEIDEKKSYLYVEIGSVNVSNGEIIPNEVLGANLPANAKRCLMKNDVIVSKVRTYRGAITIVDEQGYIGSGAFTILREKGKINKETLLAFLHSKPLLAWSLKPNTGTSYPVIVDDDILDLPIPLLDPEKQQQIQQKITESFRLRKQSKQLLENAKHAVEMAIEQDEDAAIAWLENETKQMQI